MLEQLAPLRIGHRHFASHQNDSKRPPDSLRIVCEANKLFPIPASRLFSKAPPIYRHEYLPVMCVTKSPISIAPSHADCIFGAMKHGLLLFNLQ